MLGANMLVHPLLRMDEHIKGAWPIRPIFLLPSHGCPFMDEARYTWYTISCPLVHRGCPWEGAIEKKNICATCHSLIGYQSCRSASSRWEPRVISWLVLVASYAQVSYLYIVEFLHYPLHLQNFLLWHSSSRASSRSLCVHRLLSSRSRYLLFFSSLGFQFSKNVWNFYSFV